MIVVCEGRVRPTLANAWSKTSPRAASPSTVGVRASGSPVQPKRS